MTQLHAAALKAWDGLGFVFFKCSKGLCLFFLASEKVGGKAQQTYGSQSNTSFYLEIDGIKKLENILLKAPQQ